MADEAAHIAAARRAMANAIERDSPTEHRARGRLAAVVVVAIAVIAGVVYAQMLRSPDRGTGMGATLACAFAMFIGAPCALFGLITGPSRWSRHRDVSIESAVALAVGIALLGVPTTSWLGGQSTSTADGASPAIDCNGDARRGASAFIEPTGRLGL